MIGAHILEMTLNPLLHVTIKYTYSLFGYTNFKGLYPSISIFYHVQEAEVQGHEVARVSIGPHVVYRPPVRFVWEIQCLTPEGFSPRVK